MKIALAQIDTKVADVAGNLEKIRLAAARARESGAELAVFPEHALGGYPALDMWEEAGFVRANREALEALARETGARGLVVGFLDANRSRRGKPVHNAAALLHKGKIAAVRHKSLLPTYDVFDEARYFEPARANAPVRFNGRRLGLTICEDAWADETPGRRGLYRIDPVKALARAGAEILINISASPFWRGKTRTREALFSGHAKRLKRPMLYCNLVGGNDEMIFDGNSLAFDARGRAVARGAAFRKDLVLVDTDAAGRLPALEADEPAELVAALTLGIKDYLGKCGFSRAFVGLSGGIDSALAGALAARALGAERVTGVALPGPYSSAGSLRDARALAANLGIRLLEIPITPIYDAFRSSLTAPLALEEGAKVSLAEQNLQSRIRGTVLMALTNREGGILLSTGNKSELSVGYCTLYGDMNGGLAVLADLPKRDVYACAQWLNRDKELIPRATIEKPPSAELAPNQLDQDDLPPYDELDSILTAYLEERLEPAEIVKRGHPAALVARMLDRIDLAEYKRRQSPPCLKVTAKAFGVGRRMPIARGSYRAFKPA